MKILRMTARSIAGSSSVSSRFSFPSRHLHNRQRHPREENSLPSGVKHAGLKWHEQLPIQLSFRAISRHEGDRNFSRN